MKFGLALPQYDYSLSGSRIDWPQLRDWAQRAEDLGFDSIWLSDHLFLDLTKYGGTDERQGAIECLSALAALAGMTKRVRLGSLVLCNDLRHPAMVAKSAATIDLLSQGRLDLGIGAGWFEPEYVAAGIPFRSAGARVARLQEAVQIIVGMLTSAEFSFNGRHYQVEGAINLPRAVQSPRPRVFVGGKGDRVVSIGGRYADGYNAVWGWTPELLSERFEVLDRVARENGRDPAQLFRSVGLYALAGSDDAEVNLRWERYIEATPAEVGARLEKGAWMSDKLAGTYDQIVSRIRAFSDIGVEEVILGFGLLPFQIADPSAVDDLARELLPKLKES